MKRSRHCRVRVKRGFTLVELLVGIGVVATSAALFAAAAGGVRGQAETAACAGNLKTIGQAAAQYTTDHNGWLVGAPGTSGRELLNDERGSWGSQAVDVNGDATQPFDWAGPLAWTYLAPQSVRPDRRDERFALLNGTNIPDYNNPNYDPSNPDLTASNGPLGVFADPAQHEVSLPFDSNFGLLPNGMAHTAFQPQLASSYIGGHGFLWLAGQPSGVGRPRWASAGFWATSAQGSLWQPASYASEVRLPGADPIAGLQLPYAPAIARIGDPSRKVFLADGTRFQSPSQDLVDHDIGANASYGGAFADGGIWETSFTRAWPIGVSPSGRDLTGTSFRHHADVGGGADDRAGNMLFYDGAVRLTLVAAARRPELWLPRDSLITPASIWSEIRLEYPLESPGVGHLHVGATVRIP